MNKYLIIILFSSIVLSDNSDRQVSTRIRYDFNSRENHIEINNCRDEDELLQFIESTMETHLIPGVSISIVKDNNIVWEKQLGYANIINDVLVDENTMFILSSISKTVTATALMQLFENELFDLEMSDRVYFPGRVGNISDWYERADLFVLSSIVEGFPNTW